MIKMLSCRSCHRGNRLSMERNCGEAMAAIPRAVSGDWLVARQKLWRHYLLYRTSATEGNGAEVPLWKASACCCWHFEGI